MFVKLLIEGVITCALITIYLALGIRKSTVNWVFLYEQEVQDKVISLGMITKEQIKKNKIVGVISLFGFILWRLLC